MADVFLSYSHDDEHKAEILARHIEAAGKTVWWDNKLRSGRFSEKIEAQLKKARCVVVLWSGSAAKSDWVPAEADRGRIADKLVQVRLDTGCPVPLPFDWLHILEISEWEQEPGKEQVAELLEAIRYEVERSPLFRQVRRLWKPTAAPKLRPWDIWGGSALLILAAAVMVGWGTGNLNHLELAIYLSGLFVAWLWWLMLRVALTRWLAGLSVAPKKLVVGGTVAIGLAATWAGAWAATYSIPVFPDQVSGFLVARFDGDRWDRKRNRFYVDLSDELQILRLDNELRVEKLNRRPTPSNEMALLEAGNAALLLKGDAADEHSIVFRKAQGVFANLGGLKSGGLVNSVRIQLAHHEKTTVSAVAHFFAGFTHYRNKEYGRAEKMFRVAFEHSRYSTDSDDISLVGPTGVVPSLNGSVAFFLGNCLAFAKDYAGALEMYEHALSSTTARDEPLFIEAVSNKAMMLTEMNELDPARATLEEAVEVCRSWDRKMPCAYLHYNLAYIGVLLKNYDDSRRQFATAAEYVGLANSSGQSPEERVSLEAIIQQKWSWAIAKQLQEEKVNGRFGTRSQDDLVEAREHLDKAASIWHQVPGRPNLPMIQITGARLDILDGNAPSAIRVLEEQLENNFHEIEPDVLLLLAIGRVCSGQDVGSAVDEYWPIAGADAFAGMRYFKHWAKSCDAEREREL